MKPPTWSYYPVYPKLLKAPAEPSQRPSNPASYTRSRLIGVCDACDRRRLLRQPRNHDHPNCTQRLSLRSVFNEYNSPLITAGV
jgi:hypothetical protein